MPGFMRVCEGLFDFCNADRCSIKPIGSQTGFIRALLQEARHQPPDKNSLLPANRAT
jgi:hypothetical protein